MLVKEALLSMEPSPQPRFLCLSKNITVSVRNEAPTTPCLLIISSTNYLVGMSEVGNSYVGQGVVSCGRCFFSHDVVAGHEEPAQAGHGGGWKHLYPLSHCLGPAKLFLESTFLYLCF